MIALNRSLTGFSGTVRVAVVVFCLSGCSGLIYQSIWSHYLGLFLGHAAYAQCLVLTIFMGGLAIGSWLAGRRSAAWRNLLLRYAAVEAAIGVAGLLFHPVFVGVTGWLYDTVLPAMPSDTAVALVKWLSGVLLILPQSILLGMTFPLMANGIIRRAARLPGAVISVLYFSNSIGAAGGALIATFLLLPSIGLAGAMQVAGVLNLLVALVAWALSRRDDAAATAASTEPATSGHAVAGRLLLCASFITGATSFVYEIVWVRMLSLTFGTTLHSFELMLTAFIGGLACGGLVLRRRLDRVANLLRTGAYVQIAMGLAALATLTLYGRSFEWAAFFINALSHNAGGYTLYNVVTAAGALLIMAPAAFFAGMTLPIFSLALSRNGAGESAIGKIYAANTFGAIVGVGLTVFWLVPALGIKLAMTVAALGDLALGLVLFRSATKDRPRSYLSVLTASASLAIAFIQLAPFDQRELASGVFRIGRARIPDDAHILFYRDGATASVDVIENQGFRRIGTNGKSDSAIQMLDPEQPNADENTLVLAAALPLALNPRARDVAVIGIGTGMTTNTLLGAPSLRTVDTIEIEPAMVAGAHLFGPYSWRVFEDPRSHLHLEDARVFFAAHRTPYDVIVSEPSNPWVTGTASLFTDEFYAHVTRHLSQNGVFVQWVQLYEMNDELLATITNALARNFHDYVLYLSNDSDLLIAASASHELPAADPAIFDIEPIKAALAHVRIRSIADLELHEVGTKRDLAPYLQVFSQRLNSDYLPVLSLEAPRARFAVSSAVAVHRLVESDLPLPELTQGRVWQGSADTASVDANYRPTQDVAGSVRALAQWRDLSAQGPFVDAETTAALAGLRAYRDTCGKSANAASVNEWMYRFAAATVPYLSARQMSEIWSEVRLQPCAQIPAAVLEMQKTIAALAARDMKSTALLARGLLERSATELTADTADYLLRLAMMASLAANQPQDALDLVQTVGAHVPSTERHWHERIYLQTLAESRAAQARQGRNADVAATVRNTR